MDKPKEKVYDEQISPLMTQIITICREHNIAHVCTFQLDEVDEDEGPLYCDTKNLRDECEPSDRMMEIGEMVGPQHSPALTMMTVRDGDGKVTEMHAFL